MPATSALWSLISALTTTFGADTELEALGVVVTRANPRGYATDQSRRLVLAVAADSDDQDGLVEVATSSQDWRGLGARTRDETLTVECELWSRSGTMNVAARQDAAQAVIDRVEEILRGDLSLGIAQVLWVHVTAIRMRVLHSRDGDTVIVPFTITARCRLA